MLLRPWHTRFLTFRVLGNFPVRGGSYHKDCFVFWSKYCGSYQFQLRLQLLRQGVPARGWPLALVLLHIEHVLGWTFPMLPASLPLKQQNKGIQNQKISKDIATFYASQPRYLSEKEDGLVVPAPLSLFKNLRASLVPVHRLELKHSVVERCSSALTHISSRLAA